MCEERKSILWILWFKEVGVEFIRIFNIYGALKIGYFTYFIFIIIYKSINYSYT
jgi:hypothetical protein